MFEAWSSPYWGAVGGAGVLAGRRLARREQQAALGHTQGKEGTEVVILHDNVHSC